MHSNLIQLTLHQLVRHNNPPGDWGLMCSGGTQIQHRCFFRVKILHAADPLSPGYTSAGRCAARQCICTGPIQRDSAFQPHICECQKDALDVASTKGRWQ